MLSFNTFLFCGAVASAIAALAHVGCIIFGASWYRFFGAGERIARWAEQGNIKSTLITSCIVLVLISWSVYAFSGAGVISPLPMLRVVLMLMTAIYLLRAMAGVPLLFIDRHRSKAFWIWSSIICGCFGIVHLIGLIQIWGNI